MAIRLLILYTGVFDSSQYKTAGLDEDGVGVWITTVVAAGGEDELLLLLLAPVAVDEEMEGRFKRLGEVVLVKKFAPGTVDEKVNAPPLEAVGINGVVVGLSFALVAVSRVGRLVEEALTGFDLDLVSEPTLGAA